MAIRPETVVQPPYRDGNILCWASAYATSAAGNSIYFLALAWAAREVASPAEVGMVLAAGGIPRAVLMLFGGAVVDKFGPQRTVVLSDATRCVITLGVAHASATYLGRVISVLTLVTVGTTPLVYPAMGAAIGVWGSAPVFTVCGVLCAAAAIAALCYSPLRHAELVKASGG